MHQRHGEHQHNGHPHFSVHRSSTAAHSEQHQGGLSRDSVLVVVERQANVEANQPQKHQAKGLARPEGDGVKPTPMPCVERKAVQQLHRDDDPGDAQQVHRRTLNPALAQRQSHGRHGDEPDGTDDLWKHGPHHGTDGGPHQHHGNHQATTQVLFGFDQTKVLGCSLTVVNG